MARFSAGGSKSTANVKTVIAIYAAASTPRRSKVYDLFIGSDAATPVDAGVSVMGQRMTAAGTGTAVTPTALDPSDPIAATTLAMSTITVDPTLTANSYVLPPFGVNGRGTIRWVAPPFGELIVPATASNGIAFGLLVASTTSWSFGVSFEEM